MVISVLTDNNNRATADVKSVVGKRNGKMAESGSVYVPLLYILRDLCFLQVYSFVNFAAIT